MGLYYNVPMPRTYTESKEEVLKNEYGAKEITFEQAEKIAADPVYLKGDQAVICLIRRDNWDAVIYADHWAEFVRVSKEHGYVLWMRILRTVAEEIFVE